MLNEWIVLFFLLFYNALDLNNQKILWLPSIYEFERKLGFWTTLDFMLNLAFQHKKKPQMLKSMVRSTSWASPFECWNWQIKHKVHIPSFVTWANLALVINQSSLDYWIIIISYNKFIFLVYCWLLARILSFFIAAP